VEIEPTLADDEAKLAWFAADLAEAIAGAVPGWVRRSLRTGAAAGGVAYAAAQVPDVVTATHDAVVGEVRRILAADVDAGGGSPLAPLRAGVGPMTDCLQRWGAARPPRDEFHERRFPEDPYGLGPASFADIAPDLHQPALVWGAARAHVHLRRRREAEAADG